MGILSKVINRIYTSIDPRRECEKIAQERGFGLGDQMAMFNVEDKEHRFKDSPFFDFEQYRKNPRVAAVEQLGVDVAYYHERVKTWASTKRVRRSDWISVSFTFITRDEEKGRLKMTLSKQKEVQVEKLTKALEGWN